MSLRLGGWLSSLAIALIGLSMLVPSAASAAEPQCTLVPKTRCFGIESVTTSVSTTQAGAHPDVTLSVAVKKDPESEPNSFQLKDSYAATRNLRFNAPPGLIGNPNVLGVPQQCTVQELVGEKRCPNGAQVGVTVIGAYELLHRLHEPLFMMQPPGGDVIARLGTYAGPFPVFIDFRVRSESDYGLVAEVRESPALARLIELQTTFWGVPAAPEHDDERCTFAEALFGCIKSLSRPPGSRPLPFMTNPTRCGVPLFLGVNAASWVEPEFDPEKEVSGAFPAITGCNSLPFGPALSVNLTSHHTSAPTGLDLTIKLPESDGVNVLEPAQTKDIRINLPAGVAINPGSADGLGVCSVEQVGFGTREDSHCPDSAKLAATEFEIGALPRRMKGAIYLREPEPGNLFRIWVVADDLGAHVKLPGQLDVNKQTGQIRSVVLDSPQAPLREVKLLFKSGFRSPLLAPPACGTYQTAYEFTSWAGGPPVAGQVPVEVTEGCDTGGFAPYLKAGSLDSQAGAYTPFTFTLTRQDSEQNVSGLQISLPPGLVANFSGIPRCEGDAAETGQCPAASRIGRTTVADGVGPAPLWVPQPGKDPTAVYLGGPYKGAPLSIVAVVPAQAGPFDLGDEVVRSAVRVNPVTAQATAITDPLPQIIEGIPILYKTIEVELDRSHFSLNPTSCRRKQTSATFTSAKGSQATATAPFSASNCANLPFKPKLALSLLGSTHRGGHPRLRATLTMPPGNANIASVSTALPKSEFIENAHFKTICTRVQFAAKQCPPGSIYGRAVVKTPLFDEPLEGPVYLRSSSNQLPDLVVALKGPPSLPVEIEAAAKVDSVNGGLRASFESIQDAPLSKVTLLMQGGKKGLVVNSTNLCEGSHRATEKFVAQSGKRTTLHSELKASCGRH